jgi:uncharacterized protein YlxW (UPF0749 family)
MSRSLRAPRSQALVAAVALLLGLLVVAQIRAQSGNNTLAGMSSQDLTFLVANLNTRNEQLRREIATLERQLSSLELGGSRGASSVNQIQADLDRIRAWAGLDRIAGGGIAITISGPIGPRAIEDLVNELRNAGAEAIAIDEVRVVPGTVIGGLPGSVSVDDTALDDPLTIRAIGSSETLTGSLARAGGIIAQLAATAPAATIDVKEVDRMILPATVRNLVPSHGRPRA